MARISSLSIFVLVVALASSQDFRLPLNVIPYHYDIEVVVKLDPAEDFTFDGTVDIYFTCVEATDTVIVHNWLLTVDEPNVVLKDDAGNNVNILRHEYDWDYAEFQTIFLEEALQAGTNYSLTIPYSGEMVTYSAGLWYGSYIGNEGTTEYYAGTQLQATSARALYPCFDEPGLKATFNVVVGHPLQYSAFSNMLRTSSAGDPDIDYMWDYFETTPVMSSYLVALVVGDYTRVPTSDSRQFILVRDEVADLTGEASLYAPAILNELETRLSTPFPLPKLDHAGLIGFGGGMENYGLIIYGEAGVADDDGTASLTLMAHETAHMWTGDLVTCQWWDVTWLNEGMTNFFTYYISELVDNTFPYFDYLGTVLMDNAMGYDESADALSMVVPISRPSEIGNAFSSNLIYNRGGNIGRVMLLLLGEEIFLEGMKNYFAENRFQPVREENLFSALNNAAVAAGLELPLTIAELMSPFTNQAGFPLVTVTGGAKKNSRASYTVSQKRYLNVLNNDHNDDTLWPIALTWATSSNPDFADKTPKFLLDTESAIVSIDGDDEWVLFNNERSGYYRVNYDTDNWNRILAALETSGTQIPDTNIAAIISDGFELCLNGLIEDSVCDLLPTVLQRQKSLTVWTAAAINFHKVILRAADTKAELERVKSITKKAEMNLMRTREAMTPQRKKLMELLKSFPEHLDGPNSTRAFATGLEQFWNKRLDEQKNRLDMRLRHQYPHPKLQKE